MLPTVVCQAPVSADPRGEGGTAAERHLSRVSRCAGEGDAMVIRSSREPSFVSPSWKLQQTCGSIGGGQV